MPIYLYRCTHCKKEKEIIHKINELPLIYCEECTYKFELDTIMKKVIQPVNFKIGGFFTSKTGYSKNKQYIEAARKKKGDKREYDR